MTSREAYAPKNSLSLSLLQCVIHHKQKALKDIENIYSGVWDGVQQPGLQRDIEEVARARISPREPTQALLNF